MVGPDRLLNQLTKRVLNTALYAAAPSSGRWLRRMDSPE